MPNLIDLKGKNTDMSMPDEEDYPYGTRVHVDDDLVSDLGLEGMEVGDEVEIVAFGKVESRHESASTSDEHKSVSIQMTQLGIRRKRANSEEAGNKLYPED